MDVIYTPKGRALEYADHALNLFEGCEHGCTYCYAPSAMRRDRTEYHATAKPRKDILKRLKRDVDKFKEQDLFSKAEKKPESVLLSFSSDPYQPIEEKVCVTRKAIELLHSVGINVQILTKGGPRAERDFDLLKSSDFFATTMTFLDEDDSIEWEPKAATPAERIATIRKAKKIGIQTWVSLEPVISVEQTLAIIDETHEEVDLFKVGTLNHHALSKTIDWKKFRRDVEAKLKSYGKNYYLKKDLRAHG